MLRWSRREVLAGAAVGASAIAGCQTPFSDESTPEYPEYDESELVDIPAEIPEITASYPAGVGDSYLTERHEEAGAAFGHVPSPVDGDSIPNPYVREIVQSYLNRAEQRLRVAEADSLDSLSRTRDRAGAVADAYDAAVGDLDAAAVRDRRDTIRADISTLESRLTYAGDDPIDTLVTLAAVDERLTVAERLTDDLPVGSETFESVREAATDRSLNRGDHEIETAREALQDIAEVGGAHRQAAGELADAEHLLRRFRDSVDERRDFEARFERVGDDRLDELAARAEGYDPRTAREAPGSVVDVSVEGTPAETVLSELITMIPSETRIEESREMARPAWRLFIVHSLARRVDALEAAIEVIEDGRFGIPPDAAAVAERRQTAVEAIETAVPSATHPYLTERRLGQPYWKIRLGDDYLTTMGSPSVQSATGAYDAATILTSVIPDTNERLVEAVS